MIPTYKPQPVLFLIAVLCSFAAFGSAFESPQGPTGKDNPNNNPNRKSATTKSTAPAKRSRPSASNSGSKTAADEIAFWNSIKDSTDPADFKAYLEQYPNGKFVTLAKNHLARLEAAQPKATSTPAPSSSPSPSPVDSVSPSQPACSAPPPAQPSGRPHTVNLGGGETMEMVEIPPGSFCMGSTNRVSDEKPVHQVTINFSFYMGKYEVTQAQWQAVMGNNPSHFKDCNSCPVEQVSWDDAQKFIQRLNQLNDGYTYRLPTEAEWEYACRAGTTGDYAGELKAMAWFDENSHTGIYGYQQTQQVGQKQLNPWGLADMNGNVSEWCEDWYHETYYGAPSDGGAWLSGGEQKSRVSRGGSYLHSARDMRSASRHMHPPDLRDWSAGFRVVATLRAEQSATNVPSPSPSPVNSVDNPSPRVQTPRSVVRNQFGMELVLIPSGSFMMGSSNAFGMDERRSQLSGMYSFAHGIQTRGDPYANERPLHQVTINHSFYIGKYEVTQAQWRSVMGDASSPTARGRSEQKRKGVEAVIGAIGGTQSNALQDSFYNCAECPADFVSWNDAQEFINKLNEANDGYTYRLPTEAEWEYACRAGTTGDYYAADVDDIGWYSYNSVMRKNHAWGQQPAPRQPSGDGSKRQPQTKGNSMQESHLVGGKQPNAFGLYDMSGNVWEWCRDWYHNSYDGAPTDGSAWLSGGPQLYRVLRGGSVASPATDLRSARRNYSAPNERNAAYGFRVVAIPRAQ